MDQLNSTPNSDNMNVNPNPVQSPAQAQPQPQQPVQVSQQPPFEPYQPPAQAQPASASPPVTPPRKGNSFLVMIVVVLPLVIIGGGAYAYLSLNKLKQEKQAAIQEMNKAAQTAKEKEEAALPTITLNASPSLVPGETPEGYALKNTLCYSIVIPDGSSASEDNDCTLSYRAYINTPEVSNLLVGSGITAEWKEYADVNNMVNYWNTSVKAAGDKIINQEPVQVGSVMGQRVLVKNEVSNIQSSHVFVFLPNKYTSKGLPVTGFTILTTYSDPDNTALQKAEEDKLLSSWQWK